ncbi:MAG: sodium-dependent transporter [Planctomycetota bacterium]|jgi:NSS family neurotransmitter:Na+ symporter
MAESPLLESQRENWGSRAGFVLAAIGSAVGLGNLWGFPYKVHANGGGAFLIPYIFAMLAIGVPLLILELSLGHMTQKAAPDAYRAVNRKTEPVGWWGILLGFVIITYYPVILAYCGNFLVFCVEGIFNGGKLPWAGEGVKGVENADNFFYSTFLQLRDPPGAKTDIAVLPLAKLVSPIVISLGVMWLAMYLCIFKGVKLVSKVVLWTVPLPWIMLAILTVRGLTLPGASQGLNFFLDPDLSALAKPTTWRWAFGQMFFSMSLAFGVMITYASFLHRKSDINNNATIIGLADVATSFMAGIAVFATIGAMAFATQQAGVPVPTENVVTGGPGLTFVAFPYALAQLPYAAWFGAIFFIALLTLGIDSAFSITESVLTAVVDKTGWHRGATLIVMTVTGFGLGLVFCTRGGLTWLYAADDLVNGPWGIVLLGMLEALVIGWAYRIARLREHANERSDWKLFGWWDWCIRYLVPVSLGALLAWSIMDELVAGILKTSGELDPLKVLKVSLAVVAPILAIVLSFVRSRQANTHAQHVGQERLGRSGGVVATVLVAAAVLAAGWLVAAILVDGPITSERWVQSKMFSLTIVDACWIPVATAAVALLAVLIGGLTVHRAEMTEHRPSGLARLAAGVGTLTLGSAGGLLLYMLVTLNPPADATAVAAAAESHPAPAETLSGASYIVLSAMLTLLVVGLGWCFYRAIKAASVAKMNDRQVAEV